MGRRPVHRVTAVASLLLVSLAACTSAPASQADPSATPSAPSAPAPSASPSPGDAPTTTPSGYVALGDSYTAGPGISPLQPESGFCQRSTRNWPTLLAESLGRDVTDVSCAGATTADLMSTVAGGAVDAGTGLVTVSAGGNDGGLFISLLRACTGAATTCSDFAERQAPTILRRTQTDLTGLLSTVRSAAPRADVLLVGYPRITPSSGTCPALGIPAAAVAAVGDAEVALDSALAGAAREAGVTYVSARTASQGHDACTGDRAWTNGATPGTGDGIVFHPNARGMAAVAALAASAVG